MNDNQLDPTTDFSINNKQYRLKAFLHKENDDPEKDGIQIKASLIQLLVITNDINETYPTVEIHFDSKFGLNFERTSVEDYYSEKSMQSIPPNYVFEGAGKDYIYLHLISLLPQQEDAQNKETQPYPILDTDFIITKKEETVLRNVFDSTTGTISILKLMPVSQWKLMLSYPQWTTGFDINYQEKSGKKTGLCIKEILEKSNMKIDQENFDLSGPTINLTSLVNDSALDTINKILLRHTCSDFDNDPCLFNYDIIKDFYTLIPIKKYIEHDQLNDEIGSFENITLKNHSEKSDLQQITNLVPYASEFTMDIESSFESITMNAPYVPISRHKSTFVIDARQYATDDTEKHIKDSYYNEPAFGSGMDSSKILNSFNKERENQPILTTKMPYWRESERTSINRQLVSKKYFAGQTVQFDVPGYGGERQIGRKFNIRMYAGAIDEFTKKLLGTYLTTRLVSSISPRKNFYTTRMSGVKIFPAKEENFSTQYIKQP